MAPTSFSSPRKILLRSSNGIVISEASTVARWKNMADALEMGKMTKNRDKMISVGDITADILKKFIEYTEKHAEAAKMVASDLLPKNLEHVELVHKPEEVVPDMRFANVLGLFVALTILTVVLLA
ncbi:hypothetical protein FNV43_RR21880 [Rhamnella rubrinervis]|uniref:SKP1 component POZ domain-containing protein n=1 Tax=Rhamnella rubrinervis TaxID=2594499 RepID=A0A8K0DVG1_9ROSA|nr:hypothetical protein FNV43_RR21880 [Rhamnella rubrinervis]